MRKVNYQSSRSHHRASAADYQVHSIATSNFIIYYWINYAFPNWPIKAFTLKHLQWLLTVTAVLCSNRIDWLASSNEKSMRSSFEDGSRHIATRPNQVPVKPKSLIRNIVRSEMWERWYNLIQARGTAEIIQRVSRKESICEKQTHLTNKLWRNRWCFVKKCRNSWIRIRL